jgi:hypothetical protein
MFLHMRDAHEDFLPTITANRGRFTGGVVHSFDGSLNVAKALVRAVHVPSFNTFTLLFIIFRLTCPARLTRASAGGSGPVHWPQWLLVEDGGESRGRERASLEPSHARGTMAQPVSKMAPAKSSTAATSPPFPPSPLCRRTVHGARSVPPMPAPPLSAKRLTLSRRKSSPPDPMSRAATSPASFTRCWTSSPDAGETTRTR